MDTKEPVVIVLHFLFQHCSAEIYRLIYDVLESDTWQETPPECLPAFVCVFVASRWWEWTHMS